MKKTVLLFVLVSSALTLNAQVISRHGFVKTVFYLLLILACSSCEVDYDFVELKSNEPECIIVNSILNPNEPVQVQLHRLQKTDNRYSYMGLMGAKVVLKEDQHILYEAICNDTILILDYYPKVNARYSIEVSFDDLQTVTASTQVPPAINCQSIFRHGEYAWNYGEYIIELSDFDIPQADRSSMWIISSQIYDKKYESEYEEMYTNNAFVDKDNSVAGMPIMNEEVGSIYHEGFLRVKNKNLPLIDNLVFTPLDVGTEYDRMQTWPDSLAKLPGMGDTVIIDKCTGLPPMPFIPACELDTVIYLKWDKLDAQIKVRVITASPEYDQFYKTLYMQKTLMNMTSIFFEPQKVYSNIKNGLGIFAGMNEINRYHDLPKREY
ncbi:MAG: DUF4249 domain-containing protein [Tannerella sp.]|jgi:hypothetical protein|nr:DUF4249 domain-containing protein [Tannerella sp.]